MKTKWKRMCVVLLLALCSASFAIAGGQQQQGTGKPLEISWLGWNGSKITDSSDIKTTIEKQFNVKITIVNTEPDNRDKVNLLISSGQMPDFLTGTANWGTGDYIKFVNDGVMKAIPKDAITKYAPYQAKFLSGRPAGWAMGRIPGKTDMYFGLYGVDDSTAGSYLHPFIRLDWMDKVGIKAPGTLEPLDDKGKEYFTKSSFTVDQIEQMLTAFVKNNLGGSGTYGIIGCDGIAYWAGTLMGSFGLGWGALNHNVNGELVENRIHPGMKDFLTLMNKWYKEGLIDPEIVTNTFTKMNEKLINGKGGYFVGAIDYADLPTALPQFAPRGTVDKDPNAKYLITPPEIGALGKPGEGLYRSVTNLGYPATISAKVDDQKLQRILQIYDWANFDKVGFVLTRWGVEGKDFKWAGEPNNSQAVQDPNDKGTNGYQFFSGVMYDQRMMNIGYGPIAKKLQAYFTFGDGARFAWIDNYRLDLYGQTNYAALNAKYNSALQTLFMEFFWKALTGVIDINAEWPGYVQKFKDAGWTEMAAEMAKAPLVSDLKK